MTSIYLLALFFCLIAITYSAVGFGGGSSYLALMALWAFPYEEIRVVALVCNLMVTGIGSWFYFRNGWLKLRQTWSLVIASVPMAFIGGYILLQAKWFFLLLATALTLSAVLLFARLFGWQIWPYRLQSSHRSANAALGGAIGLLSGLVGIGGGIFLAPLLHLSHWDKAKFVASTACFFIWINSLAGLIGVAVKSQTTWPFRPMFILVGAVVIGACIGPRMQWRWFRPNTIYGLTAALVLVVALRLFLQNL